MNDCNRIPKVIHYFWFGKNEKTELFNKCKASWLKRLPDYEIIEWNEDNTSFIDHPYFLQALKCRQWAFAADYARFFILDKYGGIYLDCDEEVFTDFDNFLGLDLFLGFERYNGRVNPMAGVVGAKPNNPTIKTLLRQYDEVAIEMENDCFDITPITHRLRDYFESNYNLPKDVDGMTYFKFDDNSIIFPANYFCEYTGIETVAMHHYAYSWKKEVLQVKYRIFADPVSDKHFFSIYKIPNKEVPKRINAKVLFRGSLFGYTFLLVREKIRIKRI